MLNLNSFPNMKLGEIHKRDSDFIMEATWNTDIAAKTAYMYDYFHDNHVEQIAGLNPEKDLNKVPVEIKFSRNASQTFEKDTVTFRIQFKPSFDYTQTDLKYYDDLYSNIYDSMFPIGMYIDIPDEKGKYNKWLIVNIANFYVNQFPTYEVLPVNYVLKYVYKSIKYTVPVVLRSQSSYNSGVWLDYRVESVEDQQKFICPLNRETENIFYNQRMIIDANVFSEPRAWRVSKINRVAPKGTIMTTLAQDKFDQHNDYIEKDLNGNVIGMWADYYLSPTTPQDKPESDKTCVITYSGTKPELKVNGSYKTFTIEFSDGIIEQGSWDYLIDGLPVPNDTLDIVVVSNEKQKIKFIGSSKYIGKILTIKFTSIYGTEATLDVAVVSL